MGRWEKAGGGGRGRAREADCYFRPVEQRQEYYQYPYIAIRICNNGYPNTPQRRYSTSTPVIFNIQVRPYRYHTKMYFKILVLNVVVVLELSSTSAAVALPPWINLVYEYWSTVHRFSEKPMITSGQRYYYFILDVFFKNNMYRYCRSIATAVLQIYVDTCRYEYR
eukprot:SAG31_NODE_3795_length_3876_cov_2.000794_4_plen_166_part_00